MDRPNRTNANSACRKRRRGTPRHFGGARGDVSERRRLAHRPTRGGAGPWPATSGPSDLVSARRTASGIAHAPSSTSPPPDFLHNDYIIGPAIEAGAARQRHPLRLGGRAEPPRRPSAHAARSDSPRSPGPWARTRPAWCFGSSASRRPRVIPRWSPHTSGWRSRTASRYGQLRNRYVSRSSAAGSRWGWKPNAARTSCMRCSPVTSVSARGHLAADPAAGGLDVAHACTLGNQRAHQPPRQLCVARWRIAAGLRVRADHPRIARAPAREALALARHQTHLAQSLEMGAHAVGVQARGARRAPRSVPGDAAR